MGRIKQLRGWTKYSINKELLDITLQRIFQRARRSSDSLPGYPYKNLGKESAPSVHASSIILGGSVDYIVLGDGTSSILLG